MNNTQGSEFFVHDIQAMLSSMHPVNGPLSGLKFELSVTDPFFPILIMRGWWIDG